MHISPEVSYILTKWGGEEKWGWGNYFLVNIYSCDKVHHHHRTELEQERMSPLSPGEEEVRMRLQHCDTERSTTTAGGEPSRTNSVVKKQGKT